MKILPVGRIEIGMRLAQNIFRHDGLLALPKGIPLNKMEMEAIRNYELQYLSVTAYGEGGRDGDTAFTLEIVESAYTTNTLWTEEFGERLYERLEKKIKKNKKVQRYLNELRALDYYSFVHCVNVSVTVAAVLNSNGEPDEHLAHIAYLALLHDVGRLKMKKIFNKEGRLTEEEFKELRQHPIFSYELLKKAGFGESELRAVFEHHEKFDGSGYPYHIAGKSIADLAQLILVADMYNGLSSHRPYRGAYSPNEVIAIIESEIGKSFGSHYVDVFLSRFNPYPKGCVVELNNGMTAVVKDVNKSRKTLPVVAIINSLSGQEDALVNLAYEKSLKIRQIVKTY